MPDPIPVHTALSDVYSSAALLPQGERWDRLAKRFQDLYGEAPRYAARAPGRVNVVGEHIDHAGFSVLPSAIERDVVVACGVVTSDKSAESVRIRVANIDPKYPSEEFEYSSTSRGWDSIKVDKDAHSWTNYLKAGLKGVLSHVHESSTLVPNLPPKEIRLVYSGTVPAGSGLSSSAAMTTASAIAILHAYHPAAHADQVTRKELTEVAIVSERAVGVNSGGMDQAASVFGERGKLLHIEFTPTLSATPIPIPATDPPVSFVIAHTLVTADKHVTAKIHYNLRVVECRVGARLLALHLSLPSARETAWDFGKVLGAAMKQRGEGTGKTPEEQAVKLSEMAKVAEEALGEEDGMTWDEVLEKLQMDRATFDREVKGGFEVEAPDGKLKVLKRARHVFSEARRVYLFRQLLESSTGKDLPTRLGELMNDSQASCAGDFDCSCPEINELVEIARRSGSYGSRLTGAGWGGSTVHLVPEAKEADFIAAVRKQYYAVKFPDLSPAELEGACFATKPEQGACVVEFK